MLFGRERDLETITQRVAARERLVTLWGPGGIGKTSLASEVLAKTAASFDGGAHFVALAAARSAGDILSNVAAVLGITHAADTVAIGRALAARGDVLVVLDNVEQVVEGASAALATWTSMAPRATFVVTTREILAVPGEQPYELLPLPTDERDGAAVQLLRERARVGRPSFDAEPAVLAQIVARLDGIPLAIELAAGRLGIMSAPQLLAALDDRFEVLRRGHGNAEQRQRTMQGAIDWSYRLLDEHERRVLDGLSVFRGFDLEAVTSILGPAAADAVSALRHKSLVAVAIDHDPPRFVLLQSIRDFAARALGERTADVRRAHARFYAARGTAAASRFDLQWLVKEHDNLLEVAEHHADAPEEALRALTSLEAVLVSRGAASQLVLSLDRALLGDTSREARLRALEVRAMALIGLGRLAEALDTATLAVACVTDDHEHARVLTLRALAHQTRGEDGTAFDLATQAVALASGDLERGHALAMLGLVLHVRELFSEASVQYAAALAALERAGDLRARVRSHARLGFLHQDLGRSERAIEHYEKARALDASGGLHVLEGTLTGYLGNVRREQRRFDEAATLYEKAIELLRRSGDRRFEATFRMDRGIARLLESRPNDALGDLATAADVAVAIGDRGLAAIALGYLVVARAQVDDDDGARSADEHASEMAAQNPRLLELLEMHRAHIELDVGTAKQLVQNPQPLGQHRRNAQLLLERAIARVAPPDGSLVWMGGRIRTPEGTWIDCAPKPPTRRVVDLLVSRRLRSPGEVVVTAELVDAGWPGEKLVAGAGVNRLRVLVNGLRTAGLKDVLRAGPGGYFLDQLTPIVTD